MKKNKFKILKITVVVILNFTSLIAFSQISNDLIKYWHYRNRLNNYFVMPGEKVGESQIIAYRNKIYPTEANDPTDDNNYYPAKNVDYGQHGKYQGLYICVLATEYYLLSKNGQYEDAASTKQELIWAINAVKKYWDEEAEPYWTDVSGISPNFNGFFIRGNVPCDFFKRQTENLIS